MTNNDVKKITINKTEENKPIKGIIIDCTRLNLRKEPNLNSEVLEEIESGTEVTIDDSFSDNTEFHRVSLINGVEGYCMKRYILAR